MTTRELENKIDAFKEKIDELTSEKSKLEGKLETLTESMKKEGFEQLSDLEIHISDLKKQLEKDKKEIESLSEELEEFEW